MLLMVEFWLLVWLMRAGPVVGDVTPNHSGSDPSVLIKRPWAQTAYLGEDMKFVYCIVNFRKDSKPYYKLVTSCLYC